MRVDFYFTPYQLGKRFNYLGQLGVVQPKKKVGRGENMQISQDKTIH